MKKIILIVLGIITCSAFSYSQIGINTATPDSSAAIDIHSPANENRGALLPRMTKQQRLSINSPAASLLVFDTDEKIFYYFDGSAWVGLLPKENPNSSYTNNNSPDISPKVKGDLIIDSGSVRATNLNSDNLSITGFSKNALVPTGAILIWSGDPANLPAGWKLCDGKAYWNGSLYTYNPMGIQPPLGSVLYTPDLRGKFIVGYDPSNTEYSTIGIDGGANQVTLIKANLPKHQHAIGDGSDGGSFSEAGLHSHAVGYESQNRNGGGGTGTDVVRDANSSNKTTSSDGAHRHTGATGDGTSDGLNSQPFDNRPAYYVVAYIIKLP